MIRCGNHYGERVHHDTVKQVRQCFEASRKAAPVTFDAAGPTETLADLVGTDAGQGVLDRLRRQAANSQDMRARARSLGDRYRKSGARPTR